MADKNITLLTPQMLYDFAKVRGLQDAPIRICDGMAISVFPTERTMCLSRNGVVVDISTCNQVEFDDLEKGDFVYFWNDR